MPLTRRRRLEQKAERCKHGLDDAVTASKGSFSERVALCLRRYEDACADLAAHERKISR